MRGRIGFVILMVLNPILIISFQNCAMVTSRAPAATAENPSPSHKGPPCLAHLDHCPLPE